MKRETDLPPVPLGSEGVEDEVRRFESILAAEYERKKEECRLIRERALLHLSEMERESLRIAEDEWTGKEHALEAMEQEMKRHVERLLEGADACEDGSAQGLPVIDRMWRRLCGVDGS